MPVNTANGSALAFNGINGATGQYLLSAITAADIAAVAKGESLSRPTGDQQHLKELQFRDRLHKHATYGLVHGVDSRKLNEAGWGVVFHADEKPGIREALKVLLDFRKNQAGDRYKEFIYRPGEDKLSFLSRYGIAPGPVNPMVAPYYLLLVGDPEAMPFRLQYHLDVQFAVGRLSFNTVEEYARYAQSVVDVESGNVSLPRSVAMFGAENPDDRATHLSASELVGPLALELPKVLKDRAADWSFQSVLGAQATKSGLGRLLGGVETPAMLFTASHGMGFPLNDHRQLRHQGALLCQDWPGPSAWNKAIPQDFYFCADDLSDAAKVQGLIAFHFACYGAGTPQMDDFSHLAFRVPDQIAPRAFVAALPKKLLSHPRGGALAVVGHVERAWGYSFVWQDAGRQIDVFSSSFHKLLDGYPIGAAMEDFNERYAELSTSLNSDLEDAKFGKRVDDYHLAELWTANNDARSYIIVGDPAVRLPVAAKGVPPTGRTGVETIISSPGSSPSPSLSPPTTLTASTPSLSSAPTSETTSAPAGKSSSTSAVFGDISMSEQCRVKITQGTMTLMVPLEMTVRLSGAIESQGVPAAQVPSSPPIGLPTGETAVSAFGIEIDPNYDNREGYDPKFLGTGRLVVPLPSLSTDQLKYAARVKNAPVGNPFELHYNHFSVVMNAPRRLPFFTAVNIDGELATFQKALKRANDVWSFDPRIDATAQAGNDLYDHNPFDRGHLVRRLDPAWGKTLATAKGANDDTFHFTNCSPQHERFNQGKNMWAGLEDFLLNKAVDESKRLIVFTGPVFRSNDPVHRGVQIPVEYWKVAVVPRPGGKLASLGFIVSQAELLQTVQFGAADVARTYQTSIREIEKRTGLDFGKLREMDVSGVDRFDVGAVTPTLRELQSFDDIQLVGSSPNVSAATSFAFEPAGGRPPYLLLAFDENSNERTDGPEGRVSQRILERLGQDPITDIILFSHGWKGDVPEARVEYDVWTRRMAGNHDDIEAIKRLRPGFRPLLIGLHWPSLPFGNERLDSLSFGDLTPTLPAWTEAFTRRLGGTVEVRELVNRAVSQAMTTTNQGTRLPDALAETYRALARAANLIAGGVQAPPGADQDEFDPNIVVENTARANSMPSFGLFDRDLFLSPLRQLSFWKMKDRARQVGESGIHPLLVSMMQATSGRDVRVHLMGHSFGCIVASAAVAGPPGAPLLPRQVDSLSLVQGAFSLWAYCADIPFARGTPGYFHRIISEKRVRGPILTTQSKFDRAVGTFYPLGARVASQIAFDVSFPKYGAVGTFGLQGADLAIAGQKMLSAREPYALQSGVITNLESSEIIRIGGGVSGAHSDLTHEELAHAIWSAIGT